MPLVFPSCRSHGGSLLGVVLLGGGLACGVKQVDVPSKQQPGPQLSAVASAALVDARPAVASYDDVFRAVVARVEAHHAFADGRRAFWDSHKDELRREFAAASTRTEGLIALRHVQLALGDRHCWLSPPADTSSKRLKLGVELYAVRTGEGLVIRIAEVADQALAPFVSDGDQVLGVDGVPIEEYVAGHPFESNALNPTEALRETVASTVTQTLPWTKVKEGDGRTLQLLRSGKRFEHRFTFRRPFRYERRDDVLGVDDAPTMASIDCVEDKKSPYRGYKLATMGANVCVYRPQDPRSTKPPILRYLSFQYDLNQGDDNAPLRTIKVDHDLLKSALAKDASVILDLHENHGGMNPFLFLSWFARGSWGHPNVHVRVSDAFAEDDVRSFLYGDDKHVAGYLAALAAHQTEYVYPFLCKGSPCDVVGPRPAELVTNKPVAIVTGPACTSSCDSIVSAWGAFRLGPVVGKQPMHGFTTVRHGFPVRGPDDIDMGRFLVGLSWEAFANKPHLEGRAIPLDWEAPDTFETRDTWLDDAVEHAIALVANAR